VPKLHLIQHLAKILPKWEAGVKFEAQQVTSD
jgi:hypothetical protein